MDHNVHGTHSLNRYNFLFVPAIYRFGGQRIHLGPIELGPKAANISWNPWKYADHPRIICDIVSFVKVRRMCPRFKFQNSWNSLVRASFQHFKLHRYQFPGYLGITVVCGQTTTWGIPMMAWFSRHVPIKNMVFLIFFSFRILVRYRSSCRFAEKMLHKSYDATPSHKHLYGSFQESMESTFGETFILEIDMIYWTCWGDFYYQSHLFSNHSCRYFIWMFFFSHAPRFFFSFCKAISWEEQPHLCQFVAIKMAWKLNSWRAWRCWEMVARGFYMFLLWKP